MKTWQKIVLCLWLFLLLLFLLLGSYGCSGILKSRTKVITITEIKTDTIIKIQKDTITIIREAPLYDTVFLENTTAKAKAFYDVHVNKIALQLTGKIFDVPVLINKKVTQTTDQMIKKPSITGKIILWVGIWVAIVIVFWCFKKFIFKI